MTTWHFTLGRVLSTGGGVEGKILPQTSPQNLPPNWDKLGAKMMVNIGITL